jgi:hypothetical protein
MAYGRLDVFWPDGLFKTFSLIENNISIGRSSGNTITLDTTTISRYHCSITHDGQHIHITDLDSVNGTFVDGVKLETNKPYSLDGGEEIQIGHLRMVYHQLDEMPTQPILPVQDTTQRIEMQLPAFRMDVVGPDEPFSPGAYKPAELSITNTSSEIQRYTIEVTGMPAEWIRVDRREIEIDPNDTAQVSINFKPLRRSESKPGNYTITVRVALKDNPDAKLDAHFPVTILSFGGFGMALEAKRIASGDRFRLHIHNQGSGILPVNITGRDTGDKLRYNILTPQASLAPGQRLVIQGEVKPKKPSLFGQRRIHPFDLVVRSNNASHFMAVVRGQFIEKPMLPTWVPILVIAFILLIGSALALLAALALQPAPAPHIADFRVNSTQVAQGSPLIVNWAATNVAEISLSLNGTPIIANSGMQTSGIQLDTSDLKGNVNLALVAKNADKQDIATQIVFIYQPLGTGFFTANPPQLVRYVVQNLTVSWSIPGAVTTRLAGLDAFSTTPVQPNYGADATIQGIAGIASKPFTLTLYAKDEVGNEQQQTLDIAMINPECAPLKDTVTLRAGPDRAHQVVGTIPAGVNVVVDAQDSSGKWLRAQLSGGNSGWGERAAFTCKPNFNVGDLYKELTVPTVPPPTPTIVPTAKTPAPTATATGTLQPTAAG